ncbi:MAG: hypothetical protein AAGK04_13495 [Planctomycetota bacterium]
MWWRRSKPETVDPGVCWTCGYSIEGLTDEPCPECATPVAWSREGFRFESMSPTHRRRARLAYRCLQAGPGSFLIALLTAMAGGMLDVAFGLASVGVIWFVAAGVLVLLGVVASVVGLWLARWGWQDAPAPISMPFDTRSGSVAYAIVAVVLVVLGSTPATEAAWSLTWLDVLIAGVLGAGIAWVGWTMFTAVTFMERRWSPSTRRRVWPLWTLFVFGVGLSAGSDLLGFDDLLMPEYARGAIGIITLVGWLMPLLYASRAGEIAKRLAKAEKAASSE